MGSNFGISVNARHPSAKDKVLCAGSTDLTEGRLEPVLGLVGGSAQRFAGPERVQYDPHDGPNSWKGGSITEARSVKESCLVVNQKRGNSSAWSCHVTSSSTIQAATVARQERSYLVRDRNLVHQPHSPAVDRPSADEWRAILGVQRVAKHCRPRAWK